MSDESPTVLLNLLVFTRSIIQLFPYAQRIAGHATQVTHNFSKNTELQVVEHIQETVMHWVRYIAEFSHFHLLFLLVQIGKLTYWNSWILDASRVVVHGMWVIFRFVFLFTKKLILFSCMVPPWRSSRRQNLSNIQLDNDVCMKHLLLSWIFFLRNTFLFITCKRYAH
jgi:hypothetical protein